MAATDFSNGPQPESLERLDFGVKSTGWEGRGGEKEKEGGGERIVG